MATFSTVLILKIRKLRFNGVKINNGIVNYPVNYPPTNFGGSDEFMWGFGPKVLRTGALAPHTPLLPGPALSTRGEAKGTFVTQEGQFTLLPSLHFLLIVKQKSNKQTRLAKIWKAAVGSREDVTHRQEEPHEKLPVFVMGKCSWGVLRLMEEASLNSA